MTLSCNFGDFVAPVVFPDNEPIESNPMKVCGFAQLFTVLQSELPAAPPPIGISAEIARILQKGDETHTFFLTVSFLSQKKRTYPC
jgi:hypothetical protein